MKALSIKPNSADGNINLAHLLRVTGRFHEADVQYEKALSLRPNHPQLNYFHGVVLEKLGKRKVKVKRILLRVAVLFFLFFCAFSRSAEMQNGGERIAFVIVRGRAYERIDMA